MDGLIDKPDNCGESYLTVHYKQWAIEEEVNKNK